MNSLHHSKGVLVAGGGDIDLGALALARAHTDHVVAADGAADALFGLGVRPDVIIGDMDSLANLEAWRDTDTKLLPIEEQDTTDFEKCLYSTSAPLYVGIGFTGRRFDHTLAALHAMLRYPGKQVVLLGAADAIFLAPPDWTIVLPLDARISFFPLLPTRGLASTGLEWPLGGLDFAVGQRVGTSNRVTDTPVSVALDGHGMAVMVDRQHLGAVLTSLTAGA